MADTMEQTQFEDAAQAISQGKRHLLVRDYSSAVAALAEGCGMLAGQHGEMADELGEPFLLYGRALLCLSREEAGVLGSGVPGNDEEDGEEGEEGEGEEEEEEEDEGAEKDKEENDATNAESKSTSTDDTQDEEKKSTASSSSDKKDTEKKKPETTDSKPEEKDKKAANGEADTDATGTAGSSRKLTNGAEASTSTAHLNGGDVHENGADEDAEDVDGEDDDDPNNNLQLAWEVLELAKLIILKRGQSAWKLLAEAHRLLGEVAMESGNQPGALTDLNACLDLLRRIEPADPRSMAETHYQLGLAHSLGNEFDASIEQFREAVSLLETRIKELQSSGDSPSKPSDDPFYSVEGEIKELRELLPEIQEKITDMRDFKQQACKLVLEGIKSKVAAGGCSNGAGPSGSGGSSGSGISNGNGAGGSGSSSAGGATAMAKPASDISHLVRKKRKTEEEETEVVMAAAAASPCKKPTPEKCA